MSEHSEIANWYLKYRSKLRLTEQHDCNANHPEKSHITWEFIPQKSDISLFSILRKLQKRYQLNRIDHPVYLSKLVLPSTDSLPSGGEETLIGWILFSLFLLLDASWMLILTSSSATSLEIVEILIDWIEFSLVTTLLGRTPSSLFSAMIPVGSYVPSMVL